MHPPSRPIDLTPKEFEEAVLKYLKASEHGLTDFSISLRERVEGMDGAYEIDVVARFTALGAKFVVLVECKRYSSPVKREVVQILKSKLNSTGAHKGIIFSTSGFQSGAYEYAKDNGIALAVMADGLDGMVWNSRSMDSAPPPPRKLDPVAWLLGRNEEGKPTYRIVRTNLTENLDAFLSTPNQGAIIHEDD